MILYNITAIINDPIETEWIIWVENQYIPSVMSSGLFVSSRLLKVLDSPNEGVTYCMQFIADHREKYDLYTREFAPAIEAEHLANFEGNFVSFSTLMEFIETR
jgi:D-mannonate dehydratase